METFSLANVSLACRCSARILKCQMRLKHLTMNRRAFTKTIAGSALAMSVPQILFNAANARAAEMIQRIDQRTFRNLADLALRTAKKLGASYADIRLSQYQNEAIYTREEKVQFISDSTNAGFGVRVLVNGTWGFAASNQINEIGRAHV